jgi:hypothetical protein
MSPNRNSSNYKRSGFQKAALWILALVLTVVVGRYVDQRFFRLFPGPDFNAELNLMVHDPASSCDTYSFQVIFRGDYQIDKVHVVIQMPDRIIDRRVAYAKLEIGTNEIVGPFGAVIHKAGGCEFLSPQEQLSSNVQVTSPYANQLVIDATDVENPIVGELELLRSDNLIQSEFHAEGFYDYEILGITSRRRFSLKLNLNPTPLRH